MKRQIVTPSTSRTIIGIVQDGLLGAYNLTSPSMRIDWRTAMNIMSYTSYTDFKELKKNKDYNGHELFSMIIPPAINVSRAGVEIKAGKLEKGRLSKEVLGAKKKNAIHQMIWDEYGVDETKIFLDDTQRLVNNFNLYRGFSVGYGDAEVSEEVREQINKYFETKEQKIAHMITQMENNPDMMEKEVFEMKLFSEINIAREDIAKLIMSNLDVDNNFNIMISSGSKGDAVNMGQMSGCCGAQAVDGGLVPAKYNERTSAYYHKGDDRPESRGLIKRPFLHGLEFPNLVYLLVAGRSGLISQAITTAETGYAQRKLVKSLEDVMVKYDNTVRTANDTLLQVVYGDSGADTTRQYEYTFKMIDMSNDQLDDKHKFAPEEIKNYKGYKSDVNETVAKSIKIMRDKMRSTLVKAKSDFKTMQTTFMIPVNITRIIINIMNNKELDGDKVQPEYVLTKLEEIMSNEKTALMCMNADQRKNKKSLKNFDEQTSKTLFRYALYDALSPKKCVIDMGLTKKQFDAIIDEIVENFNKNIVQPGEMVGMIGAQALGEPLTQMSLNSFHASGIASISSVTKGIPRTKELISVTKNIKTPQLQIHMTDEFKGSKEMAHKIASHIKYTTLSEIRGRINVYYDTKPREKGGFMDKDGVSEVFFNHKSTKNSCQSDINNLPWLMRIEIDREKMLEKEVTLLEIKSKFCNWWEKRFNDAKNMKKEERKIINKITSLAILSNTDSSKQPVIHIRFNVKDVDKVRDPFNTETLNGFIDHIIDKFKLKGIDGIDNISSVVEEQMMQYNSSTGEAKPSKQQVIYASGVNLKDIRYIIGIDVANTICNDVVEVYKAFGIEAARARLYREIMLAYEREGHSVNVQNLSILVDVMTSSGALTSVDRHGMNKSDNDPLSRASFEKSVEQLINAAFYGESDHMKGISSRVMAGMCIKGGTGLPEVILDTNTIEKSEYTGENKYYKAFNEIATSNIATDIINKEDEDIFMPV